MIFIRAVTNGSIPEFPQAFLSSLAPTVSDHIQQQTVSDLLQRILPKHYDQFEVRIRNTSQLTGAQWGGVIVSRR